MTDAVKPRVLPSHVDTTIAIEAPQLKPCPFCGSKEIMIDKCGSHTHCKQCFAAGPLISRFMQHANGDETLAAILAWNTRTNLLEEESS